MDELNTRVQYELYYLIEAGKQIKKELKAIKKLCDIRMENFEENEEYKELSQHLIRNKKEVKDMEKRRKEIFTEEEVIKMCYEEQKLVEKFAEEIAEKKRIPDIKFMASRGISAEDISEGTQLPLEKVKKILETE